MGDLEAPSSSAFIRKMVPPDGSCLFYSLDFLFTGEERPCASSELRALCVKRILENSATYSALRLGVESVREYTDWISDGANYGGETEILILSEEFGYEIAVVSIESKVQILKYSPQTPQDELKRIYVIYNGQHYDAMQWKDGKRIFAQEEADVYYDREAIAFGASEKEKREKELRTRRRKKIKCGGCGALCSNGSDFQSHCMEVDHGEDFGYECEEIEITEFVESVEDD